MRRSSILALMFFVLYLASCSSGKTEVQQESAQEQADKMTEELMREMEMEMESDTLIVEEEIHEIIED